MVREIISVDIGQCGIQIGQKIWKQYINEHDITDCNKPNNDKTNDEIDESFQTFFEETEKNTFIARNIMVDSEPNVIDDTKLLSYSSIFNPSFLINGKEDAANCHARGYYTIGSEMIDTINEALRKLSEKTCENLQGFILNHSICGGTGSGLGALILERLRIDYKKKSRISFTVYPSNKLSTSPVECINACLAQHFLNDQTEITVCLDNQSLYKICEKNLDLKTPDYSDINKLIAKCVSSITCGLRFKGELNGSLDSFQTNMVPYPRIHFMFSSMAPIATTNKLETMTTNIKNLTDYTFERNNFLFGMDDFDGDCDYFMAISLQFRGNINAKEANKIPKWLTSKRNASWYNKVNFVEWQPNGFKIGLNDKPVAIMDDDDIGYSDKNVTMIANNCCIAQQFQYKISNSFDLLYSQRAFVHWYVCEGMEEGEFDEAREDLGFLCRDYFNASGYGACTDSYYTEEENEDEIEDSDENV